MSSTDLTVSPRRRTERASRRKKTSNELCSVNLHAIQDPELLFLLNQLIQQCKLIARTPPASENDQRYWLFRYTLALIREFPRKPGTLRPREAYRMVVDRADAFADCMVAA